LRPAISADFNPVYGAHVDEQRQVQIRERRQARTVDGVGQSGRAIFVWANALPGVPEGSEGSRIRGVGLCWPRAAILFTWWRRGGLLLPTQYGRNSQ
jgi:hypothetical protein